MKWCTFSNIKQIRIDPRFNTKIAQFFQVIGDVVAAHEQEFTGNIADAIFFIKMHNKLYNTCFRGILKYIDLPLNYMRFKWWEVLIWIDPGKFIE